jgi:hypothetical protein
VEAVAPPRANAGPPQSVLAGSTVTLDGSGSTGASSFLWEQTGGVTATLSSTTAVKPTFTMPNTADPVIFQLTVTRSRRPAGPSASSPPRRREARHPGGGAQLAHTTVT